MERKTIEECVEAIDKELKTLKYWLNYDPAMEREKDLIDLQRAEKKDGNFKN
jgi:hypothetical protein